uniref:phosphatidylinositol-3,4,5-trisphosphate 5-phosphatase n=1 Tax=Dictyostelium discoideum TaxID=44689 RepID=Q8I7P6_DICDI|nr:inositol 5-phosphatase 1 [Dictyostelium discoideum]
MVLRGRAGSMTPQVNFNKLSGSGNIEERNNNQSSSQSQSSPSPSQSPSLQQNQLNSSNGMNNKVKNLLDLENYYKSIKKNITENQFEFSIKKKEKNRTLLVNLKDKSLTIFKLSKRGNKKNIKKYLISEIEKITKDKKDNKELIVFRRSKKKEMKLYFLNTERRECFYELIWMTWNNKIMPPTPLSGEEDVEEKAQYEKISIFISTWNMGDAPPPINEGLLNSWIPKSKPYDLYVIGVQECEYTPLKSKHKQTQLNQPQQQPQPQPQQAQAQQQPQQQNQSQQQYSECQEDWFGTLSEHLGHDYYKVESTSLVKMRIIIFAKKQHYYKINYIEKASIGTGIGNMYGNKGGTCISLSWWETSFCFMSSHFAAHQEKIEQRNSNYKDIIKGIKIGNKELDILNQYNYVFWMGDLNYRIGGGLFREEVLMHIKSKNIRKLLQHDQLNQQRNQEKVFIGFKEEPVGFLPTYKTLRGVENQYTEEKQRIPSWCDRILHKKLPYSHDIICLEYNSANRITTSDHVPVYGVYESYVRMPCSPNSSSCSNVKKQICQILFNDLRAECLDMVDNEERAPDAYIVFNSSAFIATEITTPHAYKNRNPIWGDLPPITPIIERQNFLETQHLFLTFYHDDKSIGHAAVPLGIGFQKEPFAFKTRITRNGLPAGTLFGSIHIVYNKFLIQN